MPKAEEKKKSRMGWDRRSIFANSRLEGNLGEERI